MNVYYLPFSIFENVKNKRGTDVITAFVKKRLKTYEGLTVNANLPELIFTDRIRKNKTKSV